MHFLFQYIWTPIAVFLVGFILLRLMGKTAVATMTSFDLLVVLVLGTAITEPIVTKRLGIASYYSVAIAMIYLAFSRLSIANRFKKILRSSPTVLIRNGDIDEQGLRKSRITVNELLGELRVNGYPNVQDVEMATMEETGKISVILKSDVRPLQPKDLSMAASPTFIPIPLIIDGEIIEQNLQYLNKDKKWLYQQLLAYSIDEGNLKKVTLAAFNQKGFIDVDTNDPTDRNQGPHNYRPNSQN
ncbi:DUF421 domain-containing protein [Ferviditalea candida]|uniref:DUF421 domain-containing protein n=1 Tax=Ferviditalea candida TaxID=3108399 RepID=A0ABU5ZFY3_9BACL|nr:DUF421 domain-containing protein [Paenibacillaceae bacterium T2]